MTRNTNRLLRLAAAHALACALTSQSLAAAPPPSGVAVRPPAGGDPASQQPARKSAGRRRAGEQAKGTGDAAAREARERRQAVALLLETADAARSLDDLEDRAEVQALAADALWPHDEPSARAVVMRAWGAAAEADAAARAKEAAEDPGAEAEAVNTARSGILLTIAKRDPQLAERLMKELVREEAESGRAGDDSPEGDGGAEDAARRESATTSRRRNPWDELSAEDEWRLHLADALMRRGEGEGAARVAAPLAGRGVSLKLMSFLHSLRPKYPRGADEIYRRLLERTLSDGDADANSVLLLSSYIFSPDLLVAIEEQGSVRFMSLAPVTSSHGPGPAPTFPEAESQPDISAHLRGLFYRVGAAVLLRPQPAGAGAPFGEVAALYFAIGRLLPFFEREAQRHAPALHARRAALAAEIDAGRRERLSAQAETRSLTQKNPSDPLRQRLEAIGRMTDDTGRDFARSLAVKAAARLKLWSRARTLAAEIKDERMRRGAFSVIAHQQVLTAGEGFREEGDEADWERAAAFVRGADVLPLARALGFVQAAELAARRGLRERASELLREAAGFAGQIESPPAGRQTAFSALTLAASRFDAAQAWEFLSVMIRSADGVEGDAILGGTFQVKSEDEDTYQVIPESLARSLQLENVFAVMARLDFARAAAEARALKNNLGRAYAQVAVARTRLERDAREVRRGAERH